MALPNVKEGRLVAPHGGTRRQLARYGGLRLVLLYVVVDAVGVGITFCKHFPGAGFFGGTVTRRVPCEEDADSDEEDLFAVKYEDSDTEELTRGEIEALQIPVDVVNPRRHNRS